MICNSLNLHSEFFWLFLSALGTGSALAVTLKAGFFRFLPVRKGGKSRGREGWRSPLVQGALSLTLAFAAVLGALFFVSFPAVGWSLFHLYFYLTISGVALILRFFLRFLLAPVVLLCVGYVFLVSGLCNDWVPVVPERALVEFKVLAVKDSFTSLEVDIPGPEGESVQGFSRVEGKELSFTLRWVEFPRWTFFPAVKMFFLPPIAYGTAPDSQEGEPDGSSSAEAPPLTTVLRAARQVGLLTLREEIVERSGLIPLKAYGLFYHEISNGFSIRPLGDFH